MTQIKFYLCKFGNQLRNYIKFNIFSEHQGETYITISRMFIKMPIASIIGNYDFKIFLLLLKI